ncbi:MAG: HAMP domain-containing histidine kinase [Candidatus Spechtbacteria bacterium]|nr:HAMP domain-containing histidine kinase [Candidatus Spechtbacteria bacterium]
MELIKKIIAELAFWKECKEYGLGLWQCPKFLFVVMGGVTIIAMIATDFVTTRYAESSFVILSVVGVAIVIFTIGNIIVQSFEKMAAASRMKTEFVSIVSHQLRTPLSSLKWSLDLLLSGKIGKVLGKQLEQTEMMKESNERMIKLVNDLLNVTRVEEGRIALEKEEFDLLELARELARDAKRFAEANNTLLVIEETNSPPALKVCGDRRYILMALENFIDNAIRYILEKGEVRVSLSKRGEFAHVEVKDNGVGIPKDEQRHIFQKFFRAQNIMRHRTEGSGLGLYLAKAFIELHNGKVGFFSKEGAGSTFWFELPLN